MLTWWTKRKTMIEIQRLAHEQNHERALQTIEGYLEKNPNDTNVLIEKTWIFLETKQWSKALDLANALQQTDAQHPVFMLLIGEALYGLKEYEQAISWLKKCVDASGGNLKAEYLLGLCYTAGGNFDMATAYFENLVRYDPAILNSRLLVAAESMLQEKQK
ncbi:MAG: CDC27 family protein [Bdellovibrionota bacterium]